MSLPNLHAWQFFNVTWIHSARAGNLISRGGKLKSLILIRRMSGAFIALLSLLTLSTFVLSGCDKNGGSPVPKAIEQEGKRVVETTDSSRASLSGDDGAPQSPSTESSAAKVSAGYVGAAQCAGCHQAEHKDWQGSDHDLAMKEANERTVVGNFDGATFEYFGVTSKFFQRDGRYYTHTDGPDGKMQDYPIAYTFGIYPLQQYLIEFPGGRLQALSIAWDSRPREEGGQRWFHLYPDEPITAGDPLHWTGINQNWNFQCADCHSTNLHKNYDLKTRSFDTQWAEINVGCESCHGPGEAHLQWALQPDTEKSALPKKGFKVSYAERRKAAWHMDLETGIAKLAEGSAPTQGEIPVCAQCHSRRGTHFPGVKPQDDYFDFFNPALLNEGLYHADGQINDEVYVWGSFLQSKMHGAGVTCSNCHNPHSLKLRAEGNGLCAQCHMPQKFDTAEHHLHPQGSEGAQCVSCHMPTKTYMQVDARRDHSFRVPRPDLSERIETPNACIGCHSEKSNDWAANVLEKKFGKPEPHYGEVLFAARRGEPGAGEPLQALALDESQPEIVRATAVSLLPRYLSRQSAQLLQIIAQGDSALMQLGLAQSLPELPQQVRPALAIPLLYENERSIYSLAANVLAGAPMDPYPQAVGERFATGLADYVASAEFNGDRPESLVNLAGVRFREGKPEEAKTLLNSALQIAPYYAPAAVNLADVYRATGQEAESEALLRKILKAPTTIDKAPLNHALGLSLIRQQKLSAAIPFLLAAADATNAPPRYAYVYGIALNSSGQSGSAIEYLEQALLRYPQDREILSALVSLNRDAGNTESAEKYRRILEQ